MEAESITIRDGQRAKLLVCSGDEPPPHEFRVRIREALIMPEEPWFSYGEQVYLTRSLAGQFAEHANDRYYFVVIGERIVAATWVGCSWNRPEIGALGFVCTDPDFRRRGIATALTQRACADFEATGGKALYLATGNPTAEYIYQRAGFREYNGHVMRRISSDCCAAEVDEWLFGPAPQKHVRSAHWGDLARVAALYTRPHPWLIKDYREGIYSHLQLPFGRCNSILTAMMLRATQPGACLLVLENPAGGILGTASVTTLHGQAQAATAELEVFLAPQHAADAPLLLGEVKDRVCQGHLERLLAWVAACDRDRMSLLKEAGFVKQADLPGQLIVGDQRIDLQLLLCQLS